MHLQADALNGCIWAHEVHVWPMCAGAMSWGLLTTLQQQPNQTYAQILQNTRQLLLGKYTQIPQLAVGAQTNMDLPMVL